MLRVERIVAHLQSDSKRYESVLAYEQGFLRLRGLKFFDLSNNVV